MAKYGKNNYFDGVVLPEPKEEALRRMAKGVNTTRGYLYARSIDIDKYNGDRSFQVAFTTGDDITTTQYIRTNYPLGLVISNDRMYVSMWGLWLLGYDVQSNTEYDVVVSFDVTTRASTLYVNGQLIATRLREDVAPNYSKTYFLGAYPEQTNLFTGDIALCREFNFQIPKAVVALLHNNGDPAGYVLPGTYKGEGNSYESNFSTSSERWTPLDGAVLTYDEINHVVELNSGNNRNANMYSPVTYDTRKAHVYNIEVIIDKNTAVSRCRFFPNTSYESIYLTAEDNDDITIFKGVYIPSDRYLFSNNLYCYFILSSPTTVRVRSIRVTPVGCIAEYLPQNLIPTAEGSVVQWLDSVPQPPEANGILPPLDASVGGYDLAAIGNPKIII